MAFKKGQSGNPAGKPKGAVSKMTKLRQSIEADLPDIIAAVTEQAKAGDMAACKLLMDRVMPALRPTDQPVTLPLAGADLGADGRAVVSAVGDGSVTPETGAKLLQGLSSLARITEVDELVRRIEALEKSINAEAKN